MNFKAAVLVGFALIYIGCADREKEMTAPSIRLRGFPAYFVQPTYESVLYGPDQYGSGDDEDNDDDDSGSGIEMKSQQIRNVSMVKVISKQSQRYLTSQWMTVFIPSVYTFVFATSLPLNCLSVLMFLFKLKVKKPAMVYMVNLAIADILFVSLLPFKISYHFAGNDWSFGSEMCRLVTAAFYCNMYCTVLLVTCISIDRFLAVVYPMRSLPWRSKGRASLICVGMWFIAIGSVIPLLLKEQTTKIPELGITTCHDVLDLSEFQSYYLYYFPIFCFFFFFVPLIVTSACYVGIIRCLSSTNVANKCKKTRAIFLTIAVFSVFIICFTPTNILLFIHYIYFSNGSSELTYFAYLISVSISSISCCIDPLIYYYASSQCQRQLRNLLCCTSDLETSSSCSQMENRTSRTVAYSSIYNSSIYKKLLA
ncbi:proteinase-activated receptor 1 isoform X2 [Latimeria chalumnae]|uniref:Proteinase-activated receptor 1 n=1 Tax=Latimeria chalumnae TaxID=7897 RepID=H3AMI1_LATCH|nr:PREDICTED: proteinase-activated receptor 1 isoform X2 [Latimeria chalumnae]|eukprot:XP_005992683.1 PREDICTED: proteinase-activated receptor 1 isoform X2 [Latimeria chalumnae]